MNPASARTKNRGFSSGELPGGEDDVAGSHELYTVASRAVAVAPYGSADGIGDRGDHDPVVSLANNDGLVADDYYKQGLAINQQLSRQQAAAVGHYRAHVLFTPALDRVRVTLTGDAPPEVLVMRFNHATRAGFDRVLTLERTSRSNV